MKKIKKRLAYARNFKKFPVKKEKLREHKSSFPLNTAITDRVTFSVLRNEQNSIKKIEIVSYEMNIDGKWEWVVRYDDHDGAGPLHRHVRINLESEKSIASTDGVRKYKNKDHELAWVCKDIKRNYLIFRKKFLKKCKLSEKFWY